MRLGLLSTANINRAILAGASATERVEVVAVASRDEARARSYAAEHGIPSAHGSYDGLLADPAVDAVYISLPNGMHHPWTMKALAAGKHVLCEKPYSRHPDEVEEAFDAASAAGLVLAEAFMYRHHPQTANVRRLVADGELGRLCAVKTTFSFPLRDLSDVRALPELDGGALMDVGCYCVSGIRLLAGDPEHVRGEQVTGPTGVDMAFHGTLRCADDVVGQFEASFRSPQRQRLEAVGEDGVLVAEAPWRVDLGGSLTLTRDGATEVVEVETADAYTLELVNLADAIDGRAELAPRAGGRGRPGANDRRALPLCRDARRRHALGDAAADRDPREVDSLLERHPRSSLHESCERSTRRARPRARATGTPSAPIARPAASTQPEPATHRSPGVERRGRGRSAASGAAHALASSMPSRSAEAVVDAARTRSWRSTRGPGAWIAPAGAVGELPQVRGLARRAASGRDVRSRSAT